MFELCIVDNLPGCSADQTLRMEQVLQHATFVIGGDAAGLRRLGVETPRLELPHALGAQVQLVLQELAKGAGVLVCEQGEAGAWSPDRLIRALAAEGVGLRSLPGPGYEAAALAVTGLPSDRVTLLGMLPIDPHCRRALTESLGPADGTLVCRVPDGLLDIVLREFEDAWGERRVEVVGPGWAQPSQDDSEGPETVLTVVVGPAPPAAGWTEAQVRERTQQLLDAGRTARDVAQEVARASGWTRRKVYRLVLAALGDQHDDQSEAQGPVTGESDV